ncbi:hypothetical protein SUNI508_05785 [Seiridium unicorne]|uniref:PHD-type domain-containing protein n=1 Tax=Seiridium unicorne TaxID=138068 RepID=A0ABR2V2V9_9PEZI
MSGDRTTTRHEPPFGDPNAQPPTPRQTPTSAVFPSPLFETPRNNQGSFEGLGGTPRFAEEYSVFNTTPGNLQGQFPDASASTPYQLSVGQKRPLFGGDIAAQIATHVNHFSPNTNLPLPPVDPSRQLLSSPGPLATGFDQKDRTPSFGSQDRSIKKARQTLGETKAQQTLTPPPTAHKGARKLAPKLQMNTMQNEESYPPGFVLGTPQQGGMPNFVTTPTDMFGYPLSAPATAPVFTDTRPFWDNDTSMNGMDYDFNVASAAMFQSQGHRPMTSLDWGRTNEMFQETNMISQQQLPTQENGLPSRRERPLAPKPTPSAPPFLETGAQDTSMFGTSFVAPMDNTFGLMNQAGVVDPGLLFSRPQSSALEPAAIDPMAQPPASVQPMSQPAPVPIAPKPTQKSEIRRTLSNKEITVSRKLDRIAASSPIKSSARPGLSRSFSENKGRKNAHRASLPALAPAARPLPQQSSGSRPSSSRANGRTSPLKNHHRLSSLSSIPETVTPKTKTAVKFTIDSHGRARAETTMVALSDDDDPTPTAIRSRKEARPVSRGWNSSGGEDESSEDDDPIIIPSRNASFALPDPNKPPSKNRSFALPDPNKPTSAHPFHTSRRSISEQSTSSLGIYYNEPSLIVGDADSEAETEVQEAPGSRGDAASELRKVVQDRQKRASSNTNHLYVPGSRSTASTLSPASLTEASLPTPSSHGSSIRCVCRRVEGPRNSDGFMIQCESCEHWLHGKCANIKRDDIPSVYICAFCGDTPNAHGLRGRQSGRTNAGGPSRKSAASPLAHKSFKSFR